MRHGLFLAFIALGFMACSDDGTAATSESGGSTSSDPTAATMSGSGTTSPSTTSEPSTTAEPGTTTDETGSTSAGSESTGTAGGSTGTGSGSGSSTGVETGCEGPSVDGSAIGQNCMGVPCPEGYDCIDHEGVAFQQLCGILCDSESECACPDGFVCTEFTDKAGTRYECAQ